MEPTRGTTAAGGPVTTGRFVSQLLVRVPEVCDVVEEHLDDMEGVVLLHLLMADLLRFAVETHHDGRGDVSDRLLAFVDDALAGGDEYVQNAVMVSFVEHVGGSPGETPEFISGWPAGLLAERERQRAWQPSPPDAAAAARAELDIVGEVVWLTQDQGGRRTGPPVMTDVTHHRCTAFVVPHSVDDGLAGFTLVTDDPAALVSAARGAWLLPDGLDARHEVHAGDVLVLTEGRRRVGFFTASAVV